MSPRPTNPGGGSRVRHRALLGTAVLLVLVTLAGLAAYLTRGGRTGTPARASRTTSAPATAPSGAVSASPTSAERVSLPVPPSTHSPIVFGKAAAAALWSYDTRAYSQHQLVAALHHWLTREAKYADPASIDALIPSPTVWKEMAANGQFATATVNEGHFPDSFTQALQADPGAITQAYVYAVTVSGKQSISWNGSPAGGAENRVTTLAIQCRPSKPCALAGVLPAVAP